MKKEIKQTLVLNWKINLSLWFFLYVFKTVTIWKFTNPFQWIIDIPTYSNEDRGLGFGIILMWQVLQFSIIYLNKVEKL